MGGAQGEGAYFIHNHTGNGKALGRVLAGGRQAYALPTSQSPGKDADEGDCASILRHSRQADS